MCQTPFDCIVAGAGAETSIASRGDELFGVLDSATMSAARQLRSDPYSKIHNLANYTDAISARKALRALAHMHSLLILLLPINYA